MPELSLNTTHTNCPSHHIQQPHSLIPWFRGLQCQTRYGSVHCFIGGLYPSLPVTLRPFVDCKQHFQITTNR